MAKPVVKEYRINNDFYIECKSCELNQGVRYDVNVYVIGLPFMDSLDGYSGFDKNTANRVFKELVTKYKNIDISYLR